MKIKFFSVTAAVMLAAAFATSNFAVAQVADRAVAKAARDGDRLGGRVVGTTFGAVTWVVTLPIRAVEAVTTPKRVAAKPAKKTKKARR